jgi:hypothetical protein
MAQYEAEAEDLVANPLKALASETLDALSTLDGERLASLGKAAEALREQQADVPMAPRVAMAAAREVEALRELMRFTSRQLGVLEALHRERRGNPDASSPAWRNAWAR